MSKRKRQNSDDLMFGAEDDPIGLTGAFEIIRDPQAVEYDTGDNSIGLTEAFGAVSGEEDFVHSWDEAGKWKDFDWNAAQPSGNEASQPQEAVADDDRVDAPSEEAQPGEPESAPEPEAEPGQAAEEKPEPETGSELEAEPETAVEVTAESEPEAEPLPEAVDAQADAPSGDSDARPEGEDAVEKPPVAPAAATSMASGSKPSGGKRGKHGRHAAPAPELSPRMKKSKQTRRALIVIVILLVVLAGALGYFIYKTYSESQEEAAHQAQERVAAPKEDLDDKKGDDAVETAARLTNVPNITSLLGKTTDEAVAALGHGALITQNTEVKEKGSEIKNNINVALTEEPADSKTGTPTVYLSLDKNGKIIQAGYSAAASALGFGSLSFADAIANEHVVEKTLAKIGVEVPEGSAVLPQDKASYTTYDSDGTTVKKELCSFKGDTEIGGKPCEWSAVLSYDYTTQIISGNLSDTVRMIYVYVTAK